MYYKPDNAATGILMAELAEELALHGHDVRVITSMPHYSTNSIWPEYKGKWSKRERQGQILIHRVWSYVPIHKDRLLPRFFSYLSFTLLSAHADLFVFPSLYEGFGLPVLEAQRAGTAVACSSVASLPEVAGDGAEFFDPLSVDEIAQALLRCLRDPARRAALVEHGHKNVARFSWAQTAAATLGCYRQVGTETRQPEN